MEGVWGEGEAGHLLVADLELGRVRPGVERRLDAPAGPGGGGADPVDDDRVADEGAPPPVHADVGEEAVLADAATGTVINTADIERLNATFRAYLAPLTRRGRRP